MDEKVPYEDVVGPNGVITRTFHYGVDASQLKWHQDEKARHIYVVQSGGWFFQEDGKIPFPMKENCFIHLKAKVWHRVLKGHGTLIVRIYEK